MKLNVALTMSALVWTAPLALGAGHGGTVGGTGGEDKPYEAKAPEYFQTKIELPNPSGKDTQIEVTTGSVENADQSRAAAQEIAKQLQQSGADSNEVVAFSSEPTPSPMQNAFAENLRRSGVPNHVVRLPWYYQETKRRLTFALFRTVIDGGVTFAVVLSHQVLPIEVAAAYSIVGGTISGTMQYYNNELLQWLSQTKILNALKSHGIRTRPFMDHVVSHMEYILRWMSMEGAFLGLTAASALGAAAYFGMQAGPTELISIAIFGEISFWAATAEGMSDRFIIQKKKTWETRFANELHKARFRTDSWSGVNSCLAVVLALPALLNIPVTETLLKMYAVGAGVLMIKDWTIGKIKHITHKLFWKPKASCEKPLEPPTHSVLLWFNLVRSFA